MTKIQRPDIPDFLDLEKQAENPADLLPMLEAAKVEFPLTGWFIKHPFVNQMYFGPKMHAAYNEQYKHKVIAVAAARFERRWNTFVFLHERPWRFEALTEIADEMTDAEFWALVSEVWQDSENIRQHQEEWDDLLRTARPGCEAMMNGEEREAFDALPDRITVWQGHTDERDDGWSWTTRRETAEWFARRFADLEDGIPIVTEAVVNKADVLAYLLGRSEFEILIDPEHVGDFVAAHVLD